MREKGECQYMPNLLDKVAVVPFKYMRGNPFRLKKEPEGVVRRIHWTEPENVASIRETGLEARLPGHHGVIAGKDESVYTWATDDALPYEYGQPYKVPLVIDIPEEVYAGMRRHDRNPAYRNGETPMALRPIDHGGYADIFAENVPPEFIREVRMPDGFRDEWHEKGWKPGNSSLANFGKVNRAWERAGNKKLYGTKGNFLDAIVDACREAGFENPVECANYFLEPTTKKKGILPIFKSDWIRNKPPVVERVEPDEINEWRRRQRKSGREPGGFTYEPFGSVVETE